MGLFAEVSRGLSASALMADAGMPPDPWQQDFLECFDRQVILRCCRQSGKSTTGAILALQTACYLADQLVLIVSPTLRQSQEVFRKVMSAYRIVKPIIVIERQTLLSVEFSNSSRVICLPGIESTIEGYSSVSLIIVDEAARVRDEVYKTIRPMLAVSRGRLILMSTPRGRRGFFYTECQRVEGWRQFTIVADQCPRIAPAFLEEEKESLGDNWYQQEYWARFIDAWIESFIQQEWIDDGQRAEFPSGAADPINIGLDVARSQRGDWTVFYVARGREIIERVAVHQDTMATVAQARDLILKHDAVSLRVDDTGVGGGVTDRLVELQQDSGQPVMMRQCEIEAINFGQRAHDAGKFADIRTELWWNIGEMLRERRVALPDEPGLLMDLGCPSMGKTSNGKLKMESKDSMGRRGIKSTDQGDAFALAMYPTDWLAPRAGVW